MKLRPALIHAMNGYPEFYLVDPEALFIEATNRASSIFSYHEMLTELNLMEKSHLVLSQRVHDVLKWRLTGAGRAWLKES